MALPPEQLDFINPSKNSPLKIRGARQVLSAMSARQGGVMKIIEVTPFIPLILRH